MTSQRAVCVHGHFYQPPRENPWLEAIEVQESAAPYHDWNERVTAECYAPNSAARILNGDGAIRQILNNYSRISFNIGPTLLSWMEAKSPGVYAAILEADAQSRRRFSGHGSAIAQAYSHMILPLANARDKETQIRWGIEDFRYRFGRAPEGFWLPETAVDVETLEALASFGMKFTILAPHQIRRVRRRGDRDWTDTSGARVNPRMPYRILLPSGKSIAVFAYDGPIAHDVSFGPLLEDGGRFLKRLMGAFNPTASEPQLVHLATDGEAYGHHRKFGEMALAYMLARLEDEGKVILTNYGEWLEKHPPTHDAEIFDSTSWSCAHGIERWRGNCGCNSGSHPGWNQAWRAPLRLALNHLRDDIAQQFENKAKHLFADPWRARDAYLSVLVNRAANSTEAFLAAQAKRPLDATERIAALQLMELQRHAMLMYTSCGWFFDDIAGIEAVQVLRYAGRVADLANQLFGRDVEEPFLKRLELAKSNTSAMGNGRTIYEREVRSSSVGLSGVAAHHALTALFSDSSGSDLFSAYRTSMLEQEERQSGSTLLRVGRAKVGFPVTTEEETFVFAVFHSGGPDIAVGVRQEQALEEKHALAKDLLETFERGALEEVRDKITKVFAGSAYSLKDLFREEQRRMLDAMMQQMLAEIEMTYRASYERAEPVLRFLAELEIPLPAALRTLATFVLNVDLADIVAKNPFDEVNVSALFRQAEEWNIPLDRTALAERWARGLENTILAQNAAPSDLQILKSWLSAVDSADMHAVSIDLWSAQNAYYQLAQRDLLRTTQQAEAGDEASSEWMAVFARLGEALQIHAGARPTPQ